MGLKPVLRTSTSFSALTLLVGSFDPLKPFPNMTYNVFSGTLKGPLNPTQSINQSTSQLPVESGRPAGLSFEPLMDSLL